MLEEALVLGADGAPIRHRGTTHSHDWDEVQEFCRNVYMPYRVRPLERFAKPDATMLSARSGRVTFTRFSYGTGIHLSDFDPEAGNILVLNTLRGALRHHCDGQPATTRPGESFVVDCSRTDYWLDGDAQHMQFNLTIPHPAMAEIAERWFGFVPDDRLWTCRLKFGGPGSRWLSLLDYAARTLGADLPLPPEGPLGRHIEEMVCLELLMEWARGAGIALDRGARSAAPRYVRQAEEILAAEAREAPSIGEVARRVGVSARTLSGGFTRFRGVTPRAFLAAQRLEGLRAELEWAPPARTISEIAADWGYVNLGALAGAYSARFGELPSHTRLRARRLA
ncbi:MAG: helix-turn-helix transcriptional regulator [Paenirhodobacter sp.]|uniref:AraC family transcriptional regulator n=1 Tax=Paenirhodobacter sp. TaxID=1965326 RepID=UPI003D096B47